MDYKGTVDWDAAKNIPYLSDEIDFDGRWVHVISMATRDLGSGSMYVLPGDILIHTGGRWCIMKKLSLTLEGLNEEVQNLKERIAKLENKEH